MTKTSIDILELLSSKICHDLISPIGAINNGLEILDDMGADALDDVSDLLAHSAHQASSKLQAFRLAYGAGGGDSSVKPDDAKKAINAIIERDKKITQDWDGYAPFFPDDRPEGFSKLLTCVLMLAIECLPKGGVLSVEGGDNGAVVVIGRGDDAGLKNGFADSLAQTIAADALTPAMTHAYMTGLLAQHYKHSVTVQDAGGNGSVAFALSYTG